MSTSSKTVLWVHGSLSACCMATVDPTGIRIDSLSVSLFLSFYLFFFLMHCGSLHHCHSFISDLFIHGVSPTMGWLKRIETGLINPGTIGVDIICNKAGIISSLASMHFFIVCYINFIQD